MPRSASPSKVRPISQDPSLTKVPPQNLEAEQSLLSAILLDSRMLLEVAEILRPEDFYREAHEKIFEAMLELFNKSEPVDIVTLSNQLEKSKKLDSVGGAVYLARLVDEIPLAVNAPHYARIVSEKAVLRKLINKATAVVERCYEDAGEVEDVVDFAEREIFSVADEKVRASSFGLDGLVADSMTRVGLRMENKTTITGVQSGFNELDRYTSGLQPADLLILAARPSMGKTALALNIARNAAGASGKPVLVFSLEMSKEQLTDRLLYSEARVDSRNFRSGFLTDDDLSKLHEAHGTLAGVPIYIDDSPNVSSMEVRAKARRLSMDKGLSMVVIDYLQLMKGSANAERRDLEISEISGSLKALAKELKVPVLALSQLNRKVEERKGDNRMPMLSDLRESGALEQDADVIMFIYRDDVYNKDPNNPKKGTADIKIAKQRNGPTGEFVLTFLGHCTRFENHLDSA